MRMFLNFLFMTQFEKTFANCCLIFSISTAIIVLIASAVCRAVNSKWTPEPMKLERKPYVYDPNYDRPLNELEVQY